MTESIPALLQLKVSEYDLRFVDQETMDKAMAIIYQRRPDFFLQSAERDKSWERDPTQDEEVWMNDGFSKELHRFIFDEVAKEVNLPDLNARSTVKQHARSVARAMYGMRSFGLQALLQLKISEYTKQFLDQETVDKAMAVIYQRNPYFFEMSVRLDKFWELAPNPEVEASVQRFLKETERLIAEEVAKEVNIPDLNARSCILQHARNVARLMYGMPNANGTS